MTEHAVRLSCLRYRRLATDLAGQSLRSGLRAEIVKR